MKKLVTSLFLLFATICIYAQGFPEISTDNNVRWYIIKFLNGGNALTAEKANEQITTSSVTESDAQIWKITGNATNGYTFTNKKGYSLYVNSAVKNQMVYASNTSSGINKFSINKTGNSSFSDGYEIQPKENSNISMNLWGGPQENRGVGLWDKNDQNNPVEFVEVNNSVGDVGGTTSDGLTWSYNTQTKELTISGSGDMHDYGTSDSHQWDMYEKEIEKITIKQGVTSIGEHAFSGCIAVQEVYIPNTVRTINQLAFYRCYNLTKVYIPEGVTRIDDNAFSSLVSLSEINLPKSLTFLGQNVFNFDAPIFKNINDGFVYFDNWLIGYKGDKNTIPNNSEISIKEGCVGICKNAFIYTSLSKLTVPSSLKYTCFYSFYDCECDVAYINCNIDENCDFYANKFNEIVFGNNVRYIETDISGISLEKVTIGDNVEIIGHNAFSYSTALKSIKMGKSVKIIGDGAFANCTSLRSIELPQGLDSIGTQAFLSCTALEKLSIPSSVTKLGQQIVLNNTCPLYINCDIPENGRTNIFCCNAEKIVLGNNIRNICSWAFYSCTKLKAIDIPNSITYIGDYAFGGCTSLENIKLSNNLQTIGEYVFISSPIKELVLPKSLKNIAPYAFTNISPETIYVNCNLPDRDSYASGIFWGCNASRFVIGEDVTNIGDNSFYYCAKIKSIDIPNSVKRLGDKAFSYCENLSEIKFGNGIETIGNNAFEGCNKIQKVTITDVNKWCNVDFYNELSNPTSFSNGLYINDELLTSLQLREGVKIIKPYTFYNCRDIVDINIPSSVTEICDYSFEGCRGLRNIYLNCSIPPILGYDAFYNTTVENRGTLYVPAGTKSLYSETDVWNYFRNIVEQEGTGIDRLYSNNGIKYVGDILVLKNIPVGAKVEIYNLNGILLNKFRFDSDKEISLPTEERVVMVKIGNNPTIKIMKM